MLGFFKQISMQRSSWFLLVVSAAALEATALYFQHGMGLVPCVMCIYERLALFAVLGAGLIGLIAPRWLIIRWLALALGLFGAIKGLSLALKHTDYQLNPSPWNQCPIKVDFPSTLPLNEWLPSVFEAGGMCSKVEWQFLGFSMAQWLIVVFGAYILVLGLMLISQFKAIRSKQRDLFR
ncbi:disulfide bond formation protein B [Pasteurellaceae bacterium RH1A]|nr:disulfide bond formation protein B [Pasteurellaceae bacterium RH1A]